jgi:serine/threonine-protein kinase RsbW
MSPECAHGCQRHPAVLEFDFAADLEQVPPVIEAIVDLARKEFGSDSEVPESLALVLQEAITNAVVHGSNVDRTKRVRCAVHPAPDGFAFIVSDSGPGFDHRTPPDPLAAAGLALDHGRGTFLIKQLMDEVHYTRKGAEIHMLKRK